MKSMILYTSVDKVRNIKQLMVGGQVTGFYTQSTISVKYQGETQFI